MKYDFCGKKALVTGAGQGIGKAVAVALHESGAHVFALSKTLENLHKLKDELKNDYDRITLIQCDLIDPSVNYEKLLEPYLPFHFLVNNAGTHIPAGLLEITPESFDQVFSLNFKAPLFLSQLIVKHMLANNIKGSIVNISSQASKIPLADHCAYMVSKSALDTLTRFAAWEFGPKGVRMNSVNPTVTMTALAQRHWGDPVKAQGMLQKIPLGKFAEVKDVVNSVMFLLSDESAMTTGSCMYVDGGAALAT